MSTLTDFGYKLVPQELKTEKVNEIFQSVAPYYDLMNDLMSGGLHRFWKLFTTFVTDIRPDDQILDIASGTGDFALVFLKKLNANGNIYLVDINEKMLHYGRNKLLDQGWTKQIYYIQADAQFLPFADNSFDCITLGFGLRNMTDKLMALKALQCVLKPGGRLFILEFSLPRSNLLKKLYDFYSFNIMPKLGNIVAHDSSSYQYLVESIRKHPDQKQLRELILQAGFDQCDYLNLSGGIVALHRVWKF